MELVKKELEAELPPQIAKKEVATPVYDPALSYKWNPKENVPISGMEFANVLNSIRTILSTPQAQQILLVQKASNNIEAVLSRMVELGMAVEVPPSK